MLTCEAIILNMVIWPSPAVTAKPLLDPVAALVSTVSLSVGFSASGLRAIPLVLIPTGPIFVPVPVLPVWPFQLSTGIARELSMAERTARVATVKVSPHKLLGYVGDVVTFVAMGTDIAGSCG
ncbi:MAG: hypothetical protein WAV20_05795 [Blastocatellia bacterium]